MNHDDIGFEPDSIWGQAHAEGWKDGRIEGKAELVLRQLRLRFGSLAEFVRPQVESARAERLDLWAERLLTAKTIEDVFAK